MRGRDWEELLKLWFSRMGSGSTIVKTTAPVRVVRWNTRGKVHRGEFIGFFERAGQCDFEGGYFGLHCVLEAKSVANNRLPLSNIAEHQDRRMKRTAISGGIAGLLVLFGDPFCGYAVAYEEIVVLLDTTKRLSITEKWCDERARLSRATVKVFDGDAPSNEKALRMWIEHQGASARRRGLA